MESREGARHKAEQDDSRAVPGPDAKSSGDRGEVRLYCRGDLWTIVRRCNNNSSLIETREPRWKRAKINIVQ